SGSARRVSARSLSSMPPLTKPRWNSETGAVVKSASSVRSGAARPRVVVLRLAQGRTMVRVLPSERLLANQPEGTPLPDSKAERPPVIRRTEVVAFALVALLIIVIAAVLYLARAFFLPITMAFIVGTMLSPAAGLLERYRIPRAVGAALIVTAVSAAVTFMIGLIASPVMEWSSRLPQLGGILKEKLHVFDRPLALW